MGQCSLPPVFILLQYLQFLLEHALKSGLSVGSFALGATSKTSTPGGVTTDPLAPATQGGAPTPLNPAQVPRVGDTIMTHPNSPTVSTIKQGIDPKIGVHPTPIKTVATEPIHHHSKTLHSTEQDQGLHWPMYQS